MPEYRYYSADILTGAVLSELPLYGVWLTRMLSTTGEMTGSYKLGSGQHNDTELLAGTSPGKCAMYVERDGTLIWGGIIWSRTYSPESQACQMTGQTFESIFNQVALEQDFVQQGVDQMQIFKAMINALQAQQNNNFGLDTSQIGISGIPRTVLVPGYEYHLANEVVDQLIGVDDGFDYTIDVLPSGTVDQPQKLVRTGYPILGDTNSEYELEFDYPGDISNYWWPESATKGGTKFVGLGAGAGIAQLRSQVNLTALLAAGYPAWWVVNSYSNITDQNILSDKVTADAARLGMPVSGPSFVLKPDRAPTFEGWNQLGSDIHVHIEDVRFPGGKDVTSRMIGWELTVADTDNQESVAFTIEGADDA